MFRSNELIKLTKGDEEITINPNTEFDSIPSGYKVWNSAIILKDEKVVTILKPGQITTELKGEIVRPKRRKRSA